MNSIDDLSAAVLSQIDEGRVVALTQDLIRFDTDNPPGQETPLTAFLVDHWNRIGLTAELQEVAPGRANALGHWEAKSPRPHLILNAHVDTVPSGADWTHNPHGGDIVGGRLYGRGACDTKGSLAAMTAGVEAILRSGVELSGSLTIAGVIDEEEGQTGTRWAVQHGLRGDFAILGEPTELVPMIAHRGAVTIEVETFGAEAHGAQPDLGVSAIDHMADVVVELRSLANELKKRPHPLLGHGTLHVGTISGGTTIWTVAGRCQITIDRRLLPNERVEDAVKEVDTVLHRIKSRRSNFQAKVRTSHIGPAIEIAADHPLVVAVRVAATQVLGADPGVHAFPAGTDAAIHVYEGQTPTVILGPGNLMLHAHKPDESVATSELVAAAKIYALSILHLLRSTP